MTRRLYSETAQRLGKVSDLVLDLKRALPDVIDLSNSLIVVRKGFESPTTIKKVSWPKRKFCYGISFSTNRLWMFMAATLSG